MVDIVQLVDSGVISVLSSGDAVRHLWGMFVASYNRFGEMNCY